MNKSSRAWGPQRVFAAFCNLLVFIFTAVGVCRFFISGGQGNMSVWGVRCFMFFTVDSNVLAAVAGLICLIQELRSRELTKPAAALKYVGTVAVAVTFFTVLLFLGPVFGFRGMYQGNNLFMHLISPLLCMFSLCLSENLPPMRLGSTLLGLIPTAVYGVVYLLMVVVLRRWYDFYGFNMGGMWPVSMALMLVATWLIGLVLWAVRRALGKKRTAAAAAV